MLGLFMWYVDYEDVRCRLLLIEATPPSVLFLYHLCSLGYPRCIYICLFYTSIGSPVYKELTIMLNDILMPPPWYDMIIHMNARIYPKKRSVSRSTMIRVHTAVPGTTGQIRGTSIRHVSVQFPVGFQFPASQFRIPALPAGTSAEIRGVC